MASVPHNTIGHSAPLNLHRITGNVLYITFKVEIQVTDQLHHHKKVTTL